MGFSLFYLLLVCDIPCGVGWGRVLIATGFAFVIPPIDRPVGLLDAFTSN